MTLILSIEWSGLTKLHSNSIARSIVTTQFIGRKKNPNILWEQSMQAEGLTIWVSIWSQRVIGPFSFDTTVTGQSNLYLDERLFLSIISSSTREWLHGSNVRWCLLLTTLVTWKNGLSKSSSARWIGRRGPIDWPARSPDLTSADYFLWGHIKEIVYKEKLKNLSDLKESIVSAFQTHSILIFVRRFANRCLKDFNDCIDADGHQFEHLKWLIFYLFSVCITLSSWIKVCLDFFVIVWCCSRENMPEIVWICFFLETEKCYINEFW